MVLSITNCKINGSGYLYIHEESLSEAYTTSKGHYHWRFVRDRMNLQGKLHVVARVGGEVLVRTSCQIQEGIQLSTPFPMRIITWNVRSLGGSHWKRKRGKLRQELNTNLIDGKMDFLLIQEHRLRTEQLHSYGSLLPADWEIFGPMGMARQILKAVCVLCLGQHGNP